MFIGSSYTKQKNTQASGLKTMIGHYSDLKKYSRSEQRIQKIETPEGSEMSETLMKLLVQEIFLLSKYKPQDYASSVDYIVQHMWEQLAQQQKTTQQTLKKVFCYVFMQRKTDIDSLKPALQRNIDTLKQEAEQMAQAIGMSMSNIDVNPSDLHDTIPAMEKSIASQKTNNPKPSMSQNFMGNSTVMARPYKNHSRDSNIQSILDAFNLDQSVGGNSISYAQKSPNFSGYSAQYNKKDSFQSKPTFDSLNQSSEWSKPTLSNSLWPHSGNFTMTYQHSSTPFEKELSKIRQKNCRVILNQFQQQLGLNAPEFKYNLDNNICICRLALKDYDKNSSNFRGRKEINGSGDGGPNKNKKQAETNASKQVLRVIITEEREAWEFFHRTLKTKNIDL